VRDGLVGAAVAVGVLVLVVLVLLWSVSDPAGGSDAGASPTPTPTSADPSVPTPPVDLADGETWLGDLTLDAGAVVAAGSLLRDVRAVGSDVRTGPDGVVAQQLAVDATVPFDVVGAQLGEGTTVAAAGGSQATVRRTVEVLGRSVDVVATGTVEVVDGRLVVEPRSIDVGGPDFLSDALGSLVRRFVTIEQTVDGLPEGLVLRDVAVQDDGFRASLDGVDVRIAP
jgi:LmeA-like phospholipid-binding